MLHKLLADLEHHYEDIDKHLNSIKDSSVHYENNPAYKASLFIHEGRDQYCNLSVAAAVVLEGMGLTAPYVLTAEQGESHHEE